MKDPDRANRYLPAAQSAASDNKGDPLSNSDLESLRHFPTVVRAYPFASRLSTSRMHLQIFSAMHFALVSVDAPYFIK